MRIHEITFDNFRRFYGKQSIDLSANDTKNVTLINAQNGLGKTNILNSVLWCFHGITSAGFKDKDLILNSDAKKNGEFIAKVEIRFEHNDKEYLVQRHHNINKSGSDREITKVHAYNEGGMETISNTNSFLNSVLPQSMAQYFLFDGEHALNFLGENGSKKVSDATKDVLGFESITMALEDLKETAKDINKLLKSSPNDQSIAEHANKREALKNQIDQSKEIISQYDETIKTLNEQISNIDNKLRDTAGAKEIQKRRDSLSKNLKNEKLRKNKFDIDLVKWIELNAVAAVSKGVTDIASNYIKDQETKGKIPTPYNKKLINDLLEIEKCICGRHVDGQAEKILKSLLKNASTVEQSSRLSGSSAYIEVFKDRQKNYSKDYNDTVKNIGQSQTAIDNFEQEIGECSAQIKNIDIDNITELENSRTAAHTKRDQLLRDKGSMERNISQAEENIKELDQTIEFASKKNLQAKELNEKYNLTQTVIDEIEKIMKEEQEKARIEIAELVNKRLEEITSKSLICIVDENFSVKVIQSSGVSLPMSGGETQLLSLCFTAALIEFSKKRQKNKNEYLLNGTTAPLILDAPFSNLDDDYLRGVARVIPEMADQVVFLATQKQIDSDLRNDLLPKIDRQYVLVNYTQKTAPKNVTKTMNFNNKDYQILIDNQPFDKTGIEEVK